MSKPKKEEPKPEEVEEKKEGEEGEVIEGDGAAKKGKKKLIIIAAGVLVLLIGAGLFFSGVLGGGKKEDTTTEETKKGEAVKAAAAAPVYYELPQFLVNLNSTNGHASFLKMAVTLELKDQATVAVMDANKPRIVDVFNTYLRELHPSDIQGSAGIYHLRNELLTRLNSTIEDGAVKDILFGEIIVQ